MNITRIAIDNPIFATMVMAALVVLGGFSYARLGVEAMPDVAAPMVTVTVRYPGASPAQVESDIAKPVENAVNAIGGVKMIRSLSREGSNLTFVEFRADADVARSIQDVRDKVALVRPGFPRDAKDPLVERVNLDNDEPTARFALLGAGVSARALSDLAEQVVAKGLQRASGAGRVEVEGGVERQVRVELDPAALAAHGLTVDQVAAAVRGANVAVPVGAITRDPSEAIVRVDGRMRTPADFADIVVARRNGVPIRVGQLARVIDGERERETIARVEGQPAVALRVFKAQDANLVATGAALREQARQLRERLPAGVELRQLADGSSEVAASVAGVKRTIVEGGVLTVLIVFLFLGSWRSTVITGLTLPIAVIATMGALYALGLTINVMSLMALSLCIGLLIDDAIVVRENIVRHRRLGADHRSAALSGTGEISLAVLATTFSLVAVFVPVAFMRGLVGQFFRPFGVTVAVAVLLSLFVSFTLDPMLSAVWHDPPGGARGLPLVGATVARFDRALDAAHRGYDRLLRWALAHRPATLAIAVAAFVGALPLAGVVGTELMPKVDDGRITLNLTMPVGASLAAADGRVRRVEQALRATSEVATLDTVVGIDGARNAARIDVTLLPKERRMRTKEQVEADLRRRVAAVPGVDAKVGTDVPIFVNLLGTDEARMTAVMADLRAKVAAVPGIADLDTSLKEGVPALALRLKPEQAADYGLTHQQLGATLRALVGGEDCGTWLGPDGHDYQVVAQLPRAARETIDDIGEIGIATGRALRDGAPEIVPLRAVATIEPSANPQNIRRQDLMRRIALFANVQGRPSGDVGADVQKLVRAFPLPPGMRIEINGEIEDQQQVAGEILAAIALAVIFIYLVLASQFASFVQPLVIMASLPLSIVGVMLALLATRTTLNLYSMIGIVFLMGLVTKNAILLVDFANRARRGGRGVADALLEAGQIRLRPILMTTTAMVFGMLPLALGLGEGAEQQAPMGRAIIGGVLTSTALTLIVVPVAYAACDGMPQRAMCALRRLFRRLPRSEVRRHAKRSAH